MAERAAAGHLSTEELGRRYRAARDRVERRHLQVVWLLRQGYSEGEVARVMGYSERWVAELVRRHDRDGVQGPADRRHGNAGAEPLLGGARQAALAEALQGAPPQGGSWSGPKVAAWTFRPDRAEGPPAAGLGLPDQARLHAQAPPAAPRPSRRRGPGGVQKRSRRPA